MWDLGFRVRGAVYRSGLIDEGGYTVWKRTPLQTTPAIMLVVLMKEVKPGFHRGSPQLQPQNESKATIGGKLPCRDSTEAIHNSP